MRTVAAPSPRFRLTVTTMSGPDIAVTIDLNLGDGEATIRTTDLSHAYVEENSAYSS